MPEKSRTLKKRARERREWSVRSSNTTGVGGVEGRRGENMRRMSLKSLIFRISLVAPDSC